MNKSAEKPHCGYSGKVPAMAITALELEVAELVYGTATLTIHVKDGRMVRFTTGRERSHVAEDGIGEYPGL
jgi:hypothetical protein